MVGAECVGWDKGQLPAQMLRTTLASLWDFSCNDFEHLTDIRMLCLRVLSATWKSPCFEEQTYGKAHKGLDISPLSR